MTKNDNIIICGDFGGVWTFEEESSREKEALDWLNNKDFTTLFFDKRSINVYIYLCIGSCFNKRH